MAKLVCELCGSEEFVKENDYFVCQQCGMKYSLEEARKLISNSSDSIASASSLTSVSSPPEDKKIKNLLILAERERDKSNFSKAVDYYNEVLREDPYNFEANHFLFVMNYAMKFSNPPTTLDKLPSYLDEVLKDIGDANEHFKACADEEQFEHDFNMFFDSCWIYVVAFPYTKYYERIQKISLVDLVTHNFSTDAVGVSTCCIGPVTAYCVQIMQLFGLEEDGDINQLPDYAKLTYYKMGAGLMCMLVDTPLVSTLQGNREQIITNILNNLHVISPTYIIPSPKLNGYKSLSPDMVKLLLIHDGEKTEEIKELSFDQRLSQMRESQIEDYTKFYLELFPDRYSQFEEVINNADDTLKRVQLEIDENKEKLEKLKEEKNAFSSPLSGEIEQAKEDIKTLTSKKNSLGIFKGKEKNEIQKQIDDLNKRIDENRDIIGKERDEYEAPYIEQISTINDVLKELNTKKKEAQTVKEETLASLNDIPLPKEVRPINTDAKTAADEPNNEVSINNTPAGLIRIASVYPMQTSLIDSVWGIPMVYSSYDGVEISWSNTSGKPINYITFYLVAVNKVGDIVPTLGNTPMATLKLVGPVNSGDSPTSKSNGFWQHGLVNYVGIQKVDIEFSDGTKSSYQNEPSKYPLWSDFYKASGFGEKVKTVKLGWSSNSPI